MSTFQFSSRFSFSALGKFPYSIFRKFTSSVFGWSRDAIYDKWISLILRGPDSTPFKFISLVFGRSTDFISKQKTWTWVSSSFLLFLRVANLLDDCLLGTNPGKGLLSHHFSFFHSLCISTNCFLLALRHGAAGASSPYPSRGCHQVTDLGLEFCLFVTSYSYSKRLITYPKASLKNFPCPNSLYQPYLYTTLYHLYTLCH